MLGNRAGLTGEQVRQRTEAGQVNVQPQSLTPTVGRIISKNILTLFNLINLVLAILLVIAGHPENTFFLGIAVCNTVLGIVQELRAKSTLDKLSILNQNKVKVVRDGQTVAIEQGEIVMDDIIIISTGEQICADAQVIETDGIEVDESLLTGESDNIRKKAGDAVMSGSFVTAGQAYAQVTAVGNNSYATALTMEAKKHKAKKSRLMRILNNIIRALTIVIIPIGVLLFYAQYSADGEFRVAMLGAAAAMTGMIPQGLILLTGLTLTVGSVNLARRKALVQSLYSIETLARTDVLCLDKTGTITDGTLRFESIVPMNGFSDETIGHALATLTGAMRDNNATSTALRAKFKSAHPVRPAAVVPFSSARKWSGATFSMKGSYIIGAPSFVFPGGQLPLHETAEQYASRGYRVLCLAHASGALKDERLPEELNCMALIILSDVIRADAPDTFRFFTEEGVTLKVISGDDPLTVSVIAENAGIEGADRYIDMSCYADGADFTRLVEENTVFGRVSPTQKRELIRALQKNGHTTCMTGDGVNDVLAMKESDCSVAMINGSSAARGACDFVLMSSSFSSMIDVLKEGRRVINNIETVASLYLMQTIYATMLSLLYIFLPFTYPYVPLQMTPISTLTVGIPTFFLALRANYHKPEGKFLNNILEMSLPAAITVVFNVLIIQAAGFMFELSHAETSTMNIFLIGIVGFVLLVRVAQPLNKHIKAMLVLLSISFILLFVFLGRWVMLENLLTRNIFFYLPLLFSSWHIFSFLNKTVRSIPEWFNKITGKKQKKRAL